MPAGGPYKTINEVPSSSLHFMNFFRFNQSEASLRMNMLVILRLFPSIALLIPTAHNFTRDYRARIRK